MASTATPTSWVPYLEDFFGALASFDKDYATKVFPTLGRVMNSLVTEEQQYASGDFLKSRKAPKDQNHLYQLFAAQIYKAIVTLEDQNNTWAEEAKTGEFGSLASNEVTALVRVLNMVQQIVEIRQKQIEIYQKMTDGEASFSKAYILELAQSVAGCMEQLAILETRGTVLEHFASGCRHELNIWRCVLKAMVAFEDFDFCIASNMLVTAKLHYLQWQEGIDKLHSQQKKHIPDATINQSSWRAALFVPFLSGLESNPSPIRPLILRCVGPVLALMNAKLTLYFHSSLLENEREMGGNIKSLWKKVEPNYSLIFHEFIRRLNAASICLVYQVSQPERFSTKGYQIQSNARDSMQGIKLFPCVYSLPEQYVVDEKQWPGIISIIQSKQYRQAVTDRGIVHFCDQNLSLTYYAAPLDDSMTLLITFPQARTQRDPRVVRFIMDEVMPSMNHGSILFKIKHLSD